MAEEKEKDRFYETMPVADTRYMATSSEMSWQQMTSFLVGLGLMFAALAGVWSTLQSNGQILGIFAFNSWTTALSLVAGVGAIYASFSQNASRVVWSLLAAAYAVLAIGSFMVADGKVFDLFASSYNNAWASALAAMILGYLAYTHKPS